MRNYMVPAERDGEKLDVPEGVGADPLARMHVLNYETRVDVNDARIVVVRHAPIAPESPSMWFVAVDVSKKMGDAMRSIVGFASDRFTDGTIIDEMQFVTLAVDNNTQVGAITWSRESGIIDQLYVSPAFRRRQVARRLLNAAAAYHHTFGWPGVLRADGRRTELGQAFARHIPRPQRVAPHTELSPPMDPA